jgi:homogentisate 1,2-dioxygenase
VPFYQRLGDVPRKRHIQFRDNGTLLTEEVMGLEGFTGNESILYHLQSPCRVMKLGGFQPIERKEWVPDEHAHRHFKTFDVKPDGDEVTGRRVLMWNDDVEISLCRPSKRMDYFFRNGEGDCRWYRIDSLPVKPSSPITSSVRSRPFSRKTMWRLRGSSPRLW